MEKMEKSLESVTKNFATLRTGRANPAMLDRVKVTPGLNCCIVQDQHLHSKHVRPNRFVAPDSVF